MDKEQILSLVQKELAEGKISKEDLIHIAGNNSNQVTNAKQSGAPEHSSKNLINVFYIIGAIIALIGVIILVSQNWQEIGFSGRITVTLGISLLTYIGALLLRKPDQHNISQVLFMLSASLAPLGSFVLLDQANIDVTLSIQILIALILTILYGTAYYITRKNILVLLTTGFATWLYYALLIKIFNSGLSYDVQFLQWGSMLLGAAYIFIAYGYKKFEQKDMTHASEVSAVSSILYFLGTFSILGAGISVGGFFDIVFILFIFAAFYGSVYLKSRAMLIVGALFLMAHIFKLTSKYFVDSIGWPVALILMGFFVIGVGYMTFYLNKNYIAKK